MEIFDFIFSGMHVRAHLQRHIPAHTSFGSARWKSITKSISSSIYLRMYVHTLIDTFNTLHYSTPHNRIIAMMQHYLQQQKVKEDDRALITARSL